MEEKWNELNITDILHHMGEHSLPNHAVAPPIFQTSIFCFDSYDASMKHLNTSRSISSIQGAITPP